MKAIALISGGLDSSLAAKIIEEQGIEVVPVNFKIPFLHRAQGDRSEGRQENIDISADFLKMLECPRYGFGSNMNPCIDCKILMFSRAKELLSEYGASFVVSGEVLGQRPMSQHRQALELIAKNSGLEGLLLRPLSARLLPETIPEARGWVTREKLLNFSGRTRKPQMELAVRLGIKEYQNPAGGCLLTDPQFSRRLKELIVHKELNQGNVELLKLGRHFRLSPRAKLIVGRNEKENAELTGLAGKGDCLMQPTQEVAGPTALLRGDFDTALIKLACSITCRYCDQNGSPELEIIYRRLPEEREEILKACPITQEPMEKFLI